MAEWVEVLFGMETLGELKHHMVLDGDPKLYMAKGPVSGGKF